MVAERVVDIFEVVKVEEHRRTWKMATARTRKHLAEAVDDQRPIGEFGEWVMQRLVAYLSLGYFFVAHDLREPRDHKSDDADRRNRDRKSIHWPSECGLDDKERRPDKGSHAQQRQPRSRTQHPPGWCRGRQAPHRGMQRASTYR